ncbi:hypothetical protein AB3S75_027638 [Citrus x aurantiifolia]
MFLLIVLAIGTLILIIRFLSKTSFLHILLNKYRSFEDWFHVYQSYKIPQYNENNNLQENLLYGNVSTYLNSLASLEDSQFTNLFTGSKCNDIILNLDANQTVVDTFLGARVYWTNGVKELTMRFRKKDKRRILRPYLQHVLSVAEENKSKQKEIRLHFNLYDNGRCCWRSIPFTHPATMDSVVLDGDVKNKVKSDLELFLKSKQYYNKLGRVWKRSYLLYGPSGTGKSSFVAAMARFLCYDVYDIDLSTVSDVSDLKLLLLETKSKSLILVEGIDKFLLSSEKSTAAGMLNFMDGVTSCCGEERVLVFTMNGKDRIGDGDGDGDGDDQTAMMRPGRIDVKVEFPLCDFSTFKNLAGNYLGVKDHKLFGQVEEGFQNGPSLSPAQIGELLISNRTSPTRAFKSVITALQQHQPNKQVDKVRAKSSDNGSGQPMDDGLLCRESVHTVREFRKLYGLLKGSRRKEEPPLDLSSIEKSGSRHDQT